jgi:hypothetical protein
MPSNGEGIEGIEGILNSFIGAGSIKFTPSSNQGRRENFAGDLIGEDSIKVAAISTYY